MIGDGESKGLLEDVIKHVSGYMTTKECELLYNLSKNVTENSIVEIGSHKGRSSCCLGIGSFNNNISVYSVDIWEDYPTTEFPTVFGLNTFSNPVVYKEYIENINHYNLQTKVIPIKGDSSKVGKDWNKGLINLLLIDGNHSYLGTKADFEAWLPHMNNKSYILFHDYGHDSHPDVKRYVDELINNHIIKTIEIVDSMYVTQYEY